MSRSGYVDDLDSDEPWLFIRWRGAVHSAMTGRRGQAFLREMLAAMDALPEPKLITNSLQQGNTGPVCALGAVGRARGLDMTNLDPEDSASVAWHFGIAEAMAKEIVYANDEEFSVRPPNRKTDDSAERFLYMRRWIKRWLYTPHYSDDDMGRWADDGGRA